MRAGAISLVYFYVIGPKPSSEAKFGCSWLGRLKLERQLLVKMKDCFIHEASYVGR